MFPRPRPTTLVALGMLAVAGLAAAGRSARPAPEAPVSPPSPPPAEPPISRRLQRHRVAIAWAAGAAAFLFAGVVWSGGQARARELSPTAEARIEAARAEGERIALLGRLQLAGIAARRVGIPTRGRPIRKVLPRALSGRPQQDVLSRYVEAAIGSTSIGAAVVASGSELAQRVLSDSRIRLTPAGRGDVASGRVDPRVLAVLLYLASAHGEVGVSCLITGHSRFVHGRKGVVSAHVYGRAVDISSIGGVPVVGNQQPGSLLESVIQEIISLPEAVRPKQVISLLDLSGPSFRLPDHADHLHVGY